MLDVLVDDHYRFLAVLPLKRKSEALAAAKTYVVALNALFSRGKPNQERIITRVVVTSRKPPS